MNRDKLIKLVNIAFKQKILKVKMLELPYRKSPAISSEEWERGRKVLLKILESGESKK